MDSTKWLDDRKAWLDSLKRGDEIYVVLHWDPGRQHVECCKFERRGNDVVKIVRPDGRDGSCYVRQTCKTMEEAKSRLERYADFLSVEKIIGARDLTNDQLVRIRMICEE